MKVLRKKLIKNVKKFSPYKDGTNRLLISRAGGLELWDENLEMKMVITNEQPWYYFNHKDLGLLQFKNGDDIHIFKKEQLIKTVPGKHYLWKNCLFGNELYIREKRDGKKSQYFLNLENFEITESKLSFCPRLTDGTDKFIYKKGRFIECVDIDESLKWDFNVAELGKFVGKDEVMLGSIYKIDFDENSRTIIASIYAKKMAAIDIDSGEVKWIVDLCGGHSDFFIYKNELHVISIFRQPEYYVFDIESGKCLSKVNLKETWRPFAAVENGKPTTFHWRMTQHFVNEKYIYIGGQSHRELGIFEKYTAKEVIRIPLNEALDRIPHGNAPQILNKYIFQLDGDENLHVFEKFD